MEKRKRVFIVHGWDYNPHMNWYPWIKKELQNKGFEVNVLKMPNTSEPKIDDWVNFLSRNVGKIDENTYFIGHSIGCQTIMRYLENQNSKVSCIFVAGWFNLINLENEEVEDIAKPWLENRINFEKVKKNLNNVSVILSDNDPFDCLDENSKIFKEKLNAKVIIESNKGHFTSDDGVDKIDSLLKESLKLFK